MNKLVQKCFLFDFKVKSFKFDGMKIKGILLSVLIFFVIGTSYFLFELMTREAEPAESIDLPEELLVEGVQLAKVFALATSNDNINALTYIQLINQGYTHIKARLNQYAPLIDRIEKDPITIDSGINLLFITLFFLDHSLSMNDASVKVLMERPVKKWLRRQLPYRFVLRRRTYPVPKRKRVNPYRVFLTPDSIKKGLRFLKKNDVILNKIENQYKVPREYLAAILFVETQFGEFTGRHHVLSVYNTLYHYDKDFFYRRLFKQNHFAKKKLPSVFHEGSQELVSTLSSMPLPSSLLFVKKMITGEGAVRPGISIRGARGLSVFRKSLLRRKNKTHRRTRKSQKLVKRNSSIEEVALKLNNIFERKKNWGYKQIRSLLIMAYENSVDIHRLQGSWAGAFGYCQFIPSSFLIWARDGNDDGKINLYHLEDALASTANYLNKAGFIAGDQRLIRRAIHRYNHEHIYVYTVDKYATTLQKMTGRYKTFSAPPKKRHQGKRKPRNISLNQGIREITVDEHGKILSTKYIKTGKYLKRPTRRGAVNRKRKNYTNKRIYGKK
ncbi:MAG: hypothetical protein IEMM0008_1241 [bacterium]|nr:MAG: hypothetical protein IEMM0008_1241 [bacterium]